MCRIVIEFDKKNIYRISCDGDNTRAVLVDEGKCKVTEIPMTRDPEKVADFYDLIDIVKKEI